MTQVHTGSCGHSCFATELTLSVQHCFDQTLHSDHASEAWLFLEQQTFGKSAYLNMYMSDSLHESESAGSAAETDLRSL